jgi:hypothetical protein
MRLKKGRQCWARKRPMTATIADTRAAHVQHSRAAERPVPEPVVVILTVGTSSINRVAKRNAIFTDRARNAD